jgi:hypothetical protein
MERRVQGTFLDEQGFVRGVNTPAGASTYEKFKQACIECNIFEVDLG